MDARKIAEIRIRKHFQEEAKKNEKKIQHPKPDTSTKDVRNMP